MDRKNPLCAFAYAWVLAASQKLDDAYKVFDQMVEELPGEVMTEHGQCYKYALQRKKSEALESITEKVKNFAIRDEVFSIMLAECYALIGKTDEAIDWVEHGVKWGFINYPFLSEYDRFLENIRGEDRFKKLMERVKHKWENFEV